MDKTSKIVKDTFKKTEKMKMLKEKISKTKQSTKKKY